jgi:hypothetical protein
MLRWKNKQRTPHGGWRYFQSETEMLITGPDFRTLVQNVKKHREANELPLDPGLTQEVVDYLCGELPDGCDTVEDPPKRTIGISDAIVFTKILAETFLRGNPRVDQGEADRRSAICSKCPDNIEAEGCKPCSAGNVEALVKRLAGTKQTKADARLLSCRHCGCFNKVQCWFPLDILQNNQREAVRNALPLTCWKK